MIFVFGFFAAVLIYFSYKSFRGGIDYLDFFQSEISKPKPDFTQFTSIIVPCRGLDDDLEKNLNALFLQDFPRYEIIFVVDSETDAAVSIIEKLIHHRDAKAQRKEIYDEQGGQKESDKKISVSLWLCSKNSLSAKLVIAGKAANESQKVHNLREAVLHVADESKIFVFVDSDARPNEFWLRNLIAPLQDEKSGAATGYRWFISPKRNFASQMRAAWNASIASALGKNSAKNFVWGGSMAMRRDVFEKLEMRARWRGTLSDDFAVTRTMKAANLPIYFVPQALTASVEDCSWREFFEFTTRQMKITRVYAQSLWIQSFLGSGLFNSVFVWGILNLFFYSFNSFAFLFSLIALLIISTFSIGKSLLRLNAVKLVLKGYENDLKKQFWTQNTLWIFTPAVFFYNCFCALISRKINWRGIEYNLSSPQKTEIISCSADTTDAEK
jgi:ceramide glucosyltransferase